MKVESPCRSEIYNSGSGKIETIHRWDTDYGPIAVKFETCQLEGEAPHTYVSTHEKIRCALAVF